jgi:hypothetical protein
MVMATTNYYYKIPTEAGATVAMYVCMCDKVVPSICNINIEESSRDSLFSFSGEVHSIAAHAQLSSYQKNYL